MRMLPRLFQLHPLTEKRFARLVRLHGGEPVLKASLQPYLWNTQFDGADEDEPIPPPSKYGQVSISFPDLPSVGPFHGCDFLHEGIRGYFNARVPYDVHIDVRLSRAADGRLCLDLPEQPHLCGLRVERVSFDFAPADAPSEIPAPPPRDEAFLVRTIPDLRRRMRDEFGRCPFLLVSDVPGFEVRPGCFLHLPPHMESWPALLVADPARYAWAADVSLWAVVERDGPILADLSAVCPRSHWERFLDNPGLAKDEFAAALARLLVPEPPAGDTVQLLDIRPFAWERYALP